MDYFRIQDKMISLQKIDKTIRQILQLRSRGLSQQEVADRLKIDRTFISRLERIGELRKGRSIACVGFPISNKEEIQTVLEKAGVDFIFLMTEKERLEYVEQRSGREMLNEMMDLIGRMHEYDVLIAIGSDKRTKLIEGLLEGEVISLSIGSSPITEDKWVDPQQVEEILRSIKTAR